MSRALPEPYRADIDGLRAIAVLGVVLFHLAPKALTGGYVGVDVFFVISGYLITGQIRRSLEEGNFSFLNFYAKRIRRLYPALFVTMLVTLGLSFFLLFPIELQKVNASALATALYVSNFYFYGTVDYFSHDDIRPLLHTWSLSVEEQFYLFLPAFLFLIGRYARPVLLPALLSLLLASLVYAQYLVDIDSDAAFFWSFPRFWQFAAGSLLTFLRPMKSDPRKAAGLAALGLGALALSMVLLSETSPVPGFIALVPVLGAALLIRAGEQRNSVSTLLEGSAPRFVGRISYSLYLVHWPVIVFAKVVYQPAFPFTVKMLLLGLSVALACLLYRFVECPARAISLPSRQRLVLGSGMAATAVISLTFVMTTSTNGFAMRYPADARRMASYIGLNPQSSYRSGSCLMNAEAAREDDAFDEARCLGASKPGVPQVLLIGDSFAAQYYDALRSTFRGVEIAQVTATGCRPLLHPEGTDRCVSLMQRAFSEIIPKRAFAAIVISGRWTPADVPKLTKTLRYLQAHSGKIYVLGPIVEYTQPLPRLVAISELKDDDGKTVSEARKLARAQRLDARMKVALADLEPKVRYISVLNELCDSDSCSTITRSGVPMQFDYGHLTDQGAKLLVRRLASKGELELARAEKKPRLN